MLFCCVVILHFHRNIFETLQIGKIIVVSHKLNSLALVRERTIKTERPPLVAEIIASFCGYRCRVVSTQDPCGRILAFLDRSRYCFFQVAPQLYSRG
jgi:hypothetical protein